MRGCLAGTKTETLPKPEQFRKLVGKRRGPGSPRGEPAGIAPPSPGPAAEAIRFPGFGEPASSISTGQPSLPRARAPTRDITDRGVGRAPAGASWPPRPLGAPRGRSASSLTPPLLVYRFPPFPPIPVAANSLYKKPLCFPGGSREGRGKGRRGKGRGRLPPSGFELLGTRGQV